MIFWILQRFRTVLAKNWMDIIEKGEGSPSVFISIHNPKLYKTD
jgi:hypothetical protein